MNRSLLISLFSLTTLSAGVAAAAETGGPGLQPEVPWGASPPHQRPRAVAGELAFLAAPDPSFGLAAAGVGDLDGDGLADFAVGAPGQDGGVVYVYRGVSNSVSLWTILRGDCAEGGFGAAIAGGDLDGDGYSDLVIGSPDCGGVYAYRGGPEGLSAGEKLLVGSPSLGTSLAVGDLDGDGLADLLVGDPGFDADTGRVLRVLSSGASRLLIRGDEPGERLGDTLAIVPDLDGDGLADVAVGAPDSGPGRVRVVYDAASGLPSELNDLHMGRRIGDEFGGSFVGLGDVDGDGYGELLVGARWAQGGRGTLELFSGDALGLGEGARSGLSGAEGERMGSWLVSPDEADGGHFFVSGGGQLSGADLRIFRPGGEVQLSAMSHTTHSSERAGFGGLVAAAGDLTGDGYGELLVSRCLIECEGVSVLLLGVDSDADGVVDSQDCAPFDPSVFPHAREINGDGVDQSCDGQDGRDRVAFVSAVTRGGERVAGGCAVVSAAPSGGLLALLGLALARRRRTS